MRRKIPAGPHVFPGEIGHPQRAALWQARIVCLSVFGPYLAGGIRSEQAVVFALAMWVLTTGWHRLLRVQTELLPVIGLWLTLILVTLIGTLWRPLETGEFGSQPVSHGLAALFLPLALMLLAWYWTAVVPPARLILLVSRIIVAGMSVNTAISAAQAVTRRPEIISFLPDFWGAPGSIGSVALNAASNWRYSGIFDQPAEGGMAYTLALCCLIYLAQLETVGVKVAGAGIVILSAGGILTGSKVFLLGGIPVALLMMLPDRRSRARVLATGCFAAGVLWLAGATGISPAWAGGAGISGLLRPSVTSWTAGRYGTGATLGPAVADVLRSSPWYGFGAGGLNLPYDSLWVEVLVFAGIVGVILTVLTLAALVVRYLQLRRLLDGPERRLAGAMLAVAAGSSLGIPSLTADRASVLLWLTLAPLLAIAPRFGWLNVSATRQVNHTA